MHPPFGHATAPDGSRIACAVRGDAQLEPLVLIPGLGAAASVFDPILEHLLHRYRVIQFDPRGIGDSDPIREGLTMATLAHDVTVVLDEVGVDSAHVLGASMGGVVAQHVVVRHPGRVRGLILAATAPGGRKVVPADPRATDALLGRGARTPGDAYRRATTVLYSTHFQRTHQEFIEAQIRDRTEHPVRPRVFTAQMSALGNAADIMDELGRVTAPTLVTHGTVDAVTPIENAHTLAARIPGARTRWFDGCGHLFFHERPQESARVFHEFLHDVGAAVTYAEGSSSV